MLLSGMVWVARLDLPTRDAIAESTRKGFPSLANIFHVIPVVFFASMFGWFWGYCRFTVFRIWTPQVPKVFVPPCGHAIHTICLGMGASVGNWHCQYATPPTYPEPPPLYQINLQQGLIFYCYFYCYQYFISKYYDDYDLMFFEGGPGLKKRPKI